VAEWGQAQAEKQAVEGSDPHRGHRHISEGDTAVFWGVESEPLNGRVQTIVFQVGGCSALT
jgi:hypothetical protein